MVDMMKNLVLKKKECDTIALKIVHRLIEPNVDRNFLLEKAIQIHRAHWDDIVQERKLTGICGWVLCDSTLSIPPRQQYVIRKHKVLDITDRKHYCSSLCYGFSSHFKLQIPESPLWLRDEEPKPTFKLIETDTDKNLVSLDGIIVNLNKLDMESSEREQAQKHGDNEVIKPESEIG